MHKAEQRCESLSLQQAANFGSNEIHSTHEALNYWCNLCKINSGTISSSSSSRKEEEEVNRWMDGRRAGRMIGRVGRRMDGMDGRKCVQNDKQEIL